MSAVGKKIMKATMLTSPILYKFGGIWSFDWLYMGTHTRMLSVSLIKKLCLGRKYDCLSNINNSFTMLWSGNRGVIQTDTKW